MRTFSGEYFTVLNFSTALGEVEVLLQVFEGDKMLTFTRYKPLKFYKAYFDLIMQ